MCPDIPFLVQVKEEKNDRIHEIGCLFLVKVVH